MWEHWELITQLTGAGGVGGIFFVHWKLITGKLVTQLMRWGQCPPDMLDLFQMYYYL